MLSPVNKVCNGEGTFTCSSAFYTASELLERAEKQKKVVMSKRKGIIHGRTVEGSP